MAVLEWHGLRGKKIQKKRGVPFGNWVRREKVSERGSILGPARKIEKQKLGDMQSLPLPPLNNKIKKEKHSILGYIDRISSSRNLVNASNPRNE